jgi:hypothetical protein
MPQANTDSTFGYRPPSRPRRRSLWRWCGTEVPLLTGALVALVLLVLNPSARLLAQARGGLSDEREPARLHQRL